MVRAGEHLNSDSWSLEGEEDSPKLEQQRRKVMQANAKEVGKGEHWRCPLWPGAVLQLDPRNTAKPAEEGGRAPRAAPSPLPLKGVIRNLRPGHLPPAVPWPLGGTGGVSLLSGPPRLSAPAQGPPAPPLHSRGTEDCLSRPAHVICASHASWVWMEQSERKHCESISIQTVLGLETVGDFIR